MSYYEAQELNFRRDPEYVTKHSYPLLRTRHELQRESCWGLSEKVEMIDTCFQGWLCPPIYIIKHMESTGIVPDGEEHVFDGAHKLESVFEFIAGGFALKSTNTACKEIKENDGKYFADLSLELKNRIRKYRFVVNTIDDETAHDPERLRTLWKRLNRAGKKLNSYELEIPVIRPLITAVLNPAAELFKHTALFTKDKSHRGDLEQLLQVLLALIDIPEPEFSSQNALILQWHTTELGPTMVERVAKVAEKGGFWMEGLTRCHKILEELTQLNVFCDADGNSDIAEALRKTELPFVLGRLARRFERIEQFRSQKQVIAKRLREELFSKSPQDMLARIGGTGRNGTFQKKLLRIIDRIMDELAGCVQPRLFTKAQKKERLKEQGGLCTLCEEKILAHHMVDGDHVTEWSEGGATTMENLQVVHRNCHQAKISGTI
jgi:hypothetical protein